MTLLLRITVPHWLVHRLLTASAAVLTAACLHGPLWGQWAYNGSNGIYSTPTSYSVGVGILGTNPFAKLDVEGGSLGNLITGGNGTANWLPWTDGSHVFQLKLGSLFAIQVQATNGTFPNLFVVNTSGQVGINTATPGQCGASYTPPCVLTVNGAMAAKEIIVTNGITADYVFKPDYRLKPLTEVASFIQEHHHLPEIPSEAEVKTNGISVGDMQVKLLAKVEELTLHMIQAEQRNNRLEQQNRELNARIDRLEVRNGEEE